MSIETTRETLLRYINSGHSDVRVLAEDVVFTIMATGAEHRGRDGVMAMLKYFYHVAFDATASTRVTLFGETNAMVEGELRVPLCVVYDLDHDQIQRGRVYFEMPVLIQQLGAG